MRGTRFYHLRTYKQRMNPKSVARCFLEEGAVAHKTASRRDARRRLFSHYSQLHRTGSERREHDESLRSF
jgi:hypothetical protein